MEKGNKKSSTKYSPDNVPLRILYQCYFMGIGVALLVLSIVAFTLLSENLINYNYILANWKSDVFVGVEVVQGDCPQEMETLTSYMWPGTI
jgi:hypothetical protein